MITQDELKEHLEYHPLSGVFTWKIIASNKQRLLDCDAGCFDTKGYLVIKLGGIPYKAHRLAFLYMNGEIPDIVDHKDRDPSNNSWDNLRSADVFINNRNRACAKHKEIQHIGVYKDKGRSNFRARIWNGGKNVNLGVFDSIEEAVAARKQAQQIMWGDVV